MENASMLSRNKEKALQQAELLTAEELDREMGLWDEVYSRMYERRQLLKLQEKREATGFKVGDCFLISEFQGKGFRETLTLFQVDEVADYELHTRKMFLRGPQIRIKWKVERGGSPGRISELEIEDHRHVQGNCKSSVCVNDVGDAEEVAKLQRCLIRERDYQYLERQFEKATADHLAAIQRAVRFVSVAPNTNGES